MEETLLTLREVAYLLRVDIATVRRWGITGALEVIELPHVASKNQRIIRRVRASTVNKILGQEQK